MEDYTLASLLFDGALAVIPFVMVIGFGFFCHAGQPKPNEVYDTGPDDREEQQREYGRSSFRRHLYNAQTDDDVMDAIDWARYALRLSPTDIEEILDEVKPLGAPEQKAALAVRRAFQLGHAY